MDSYNLRRLGGKRKIIRRSAMSARSPRLPPEVIDLALDYLYDDVKTLLKCSLVCHSWLPRTRAHLFPSITLRTVAEYTEFERLLKTSPHMAHYVRELTITKLRRASQATTVDRELPRILQRLSRVESLVVRSWAATSMSDGMRDNLGAFLMNVKHLSLGHHEIYDTDLLRVLSACASLSSLSVSMLKIVRTASPASKAQGRMDSMELDTFKGGWDWNAAASCLLKMTLAVRLRTVIISMSARDSPSTLMNLLKSCGPHLEHLTLAFRWRGLPDDAAWRNLSLAQNPHLVSLDLRYDTGNRFCEDRVVQDIPYFLSLIRPLHKSLQRICIAIYPADMLLRNPHVPLRQIDDTLSHIARDHPNLEIVFEVSGSQSSLTNTGVQAAVDAIRGGLPMLCAGSMRFGVACGMRWKQDVVVGTMQLTGVRERWFP